MNAPIVYKQVYKVYKEECKEKFANTEQKSVVWYNDEGW